MCLSVIMYSGYISRIILFCRRYTFFFSLEDIDSVTKWISSLSWLTSIWIAYPQFSCGYNSIHVFAVGKRTFSPRDSVWRWRPRTAKRLLAMVIADIVLCFSYAPNETQDCLSVFESLLRGVHLLNFTVVLGSLSCWDLLKSLPFPHNFWVQIVWRVNSNSQLISISQSLCFWRQVNWWRIYDASFLLYYKYVKVCNEQQSCIYNRGCNFKRLSD